MNFLHFNNEREIEDLNVILEEEKVKGAESGGVFGSIFHGGRRLDSDIDVVINNPKSPIYGDIDYRTGEKSGTLFHIFRKRPGLRDGDSRFEEIQNTAELESKKLFEKK